MIIVVTIKLVTVKEFKDHATKFLRSRDVVLITRRGKPAQSRGNIFILGVYPTAEEEYTLLDEF